MPGGLPKTFERVYRGFRDGFKLSFIAPKSEQRTGERLTSGTPRARLLALFPSASLRYHYRSLQYE